MENNLSLKSTPKDVFLHLFNILTFYISVIALIALYLQYISALFPDALNFYFTGLADRVRWFASLLIIAVPAYLLTSWFLARDLNLNPKKRDLKLRHWLIYFTLFIAAVTIIVDLVTLVNNFLGGELTIQFFLKILVVLVLAAAVFGYHFWDLKRQNLQSQTPKILAWTVVVVVLLSIILGFFIIGTPQAQRQRRFDEQRVQNLQLLQSQLINYWVQKESLPQELIQLEDSISGFVLPHDPESAVAYEYQVVNPLAFELCATFTTISDDFGRGSFKPAIQPVAPYEAFGQNWDHQAGRVCFLRTIDPELYKYEKNNPRLKTPLD